MNEMLLQFIWQYSLYNPVGLKTNGGEPVTVIHPGMRNRDAGPDFSEARVRVGKTTLVGNVELHVHSSDWARHGHARDAAYRNIILHVVFIDDDERDHGSFPVLSLGPHIPAYVIDRYTNLIQTAQPIPCARQLPGIGSLVKQSWLTRLLAGRWEAKLSDWKELLEATAGDWRNLLYWRMAANFGFKVNASPFLMLARSLPINILARHKENLFQIEALLFGQAGMLEAEFEDDYPRRLQTEYRYLKLKYGLVPLEAHLWKFMRMRPPNFPTIRIAQFAALVHRSLHLFSHIVELFSIKDLRSLLEVSASEYWTSHYRFDEAHEHLQVRALGKDSIDNILINTVAPVQFLYAHSHGHIANQEKALQMLAEIPAEWNKYIAIWAEQGWEPGNAADSQALIQLFHQYCAPRKCLECAIGLSIIKKQNVYNG